MDSPERLTLICTGPVELSTCANEIWDAPWPITRGTGEEEIVSHPTSFLISKVASRFVASLDPRLSTLAVMRNCSLGLGTGGSVLTAPSLNARSTPWGRCNTGNSTDCSLSSSSISSISLEGSNEIDRVLSPKDNGFQ